MTSHQTRVIIVETAARWDHLRRAPGVIEDGQDLFDEVSGIRYISPARAWQFGA